jgi:hypothetical protein
VKGPETLIIEDLTNMKNKEESMYKSLLAVGSLKGKDYEVLFSILNRPSKNH